MLDTSFVVRVVVVVSFASNGWCGCQEDADATALAAAGIDQCAEPQCCVSTNDAYLELCSSTCCSKECPANTPTPISDISTTKKATTATTTTPTPTPTTPTPTIHPTPKPHNNPLGSNLLPLDKKSFLNIKCAFPRVPVFCWIDPCDASPCPRQPLAQCTLNRCGQCSAIWTLKSKVLDHARDCTRLTPTPTPTPALTSYREPTPTPSVGGSVVRTTTSRTSTLASIPCGNGSENLITFLNPASALTTQWGNASNWNLGHIPQQGSIAVFPTPQLQSQTRTAPITLLHLGKTATALGVRFAKGSAVRLRFNENSAKLKFSETCAVEPPTVEPPTDDPTSNSADAIRSVIIGGAVAGCVLVCIVIVVVVLCLRGRRRKHKDDTIPHHFTLDSKQSSRDGMNAQAVHVNPTYEVAHINNNNNNDNNTNDDVDNNDDDNNTNDNINNDINNNTNSNNHNQQQQQFENHLYVVTTTPEEDSNTSVVDGDDGFNVVNDDDAVNDDDGDVVDDDNDGGVVMPTTNADADTDTSENIVAAENVATK